MSKKISEYFKVTPKSQNSAECGSKIKIEKNIEVGDNLSVIRDCKVIIKDIKNQLPKNLQLSETFELNCSQNTKTTKIDRNENENCKFCNMKLSCLTSLRQHIKSIHSSEANLLSCSFCSRKFFKEIFLNRHIKNKHPDGQVEQFECDFDGKIFISMSLLKQHMKIHLSSVKCKICSRIVKLNGLRSHLKNFHASEEKFQCKICMKTFKSVKYLSNHVKTHNKEFQCEICMKKFQLNCLLKRHKIFYHEDARSFECEICNKKFNQKGHLKSHQKTHNKNRPKPFKCQQCDFATDNKGGFKFHQKSHEQQVKKLALLKNPVKCEKYSKYFQNEKLRNQHMLHAHPKNLYQCDLCAKCIKVKS